MQINLFVVCEKQQELTDLEKVVAELKNSKNDTTACLVDFSEFTGEKLQISSELFDEIKHPKAAFTTRYYNLSFVKKIITIFYGILILSSYARQYKITHFMYGIPIVFFRAMNFIPFRQYKTYSYVRSTVVADDVKRQKWPLYIRRILNNFNLTKPYISDKFFCIDDATAKYINSFYADQPSNKAINIGSIYSQNLRKERSILQKKSTADNSKLKNIYFITSAFAWHGDLEAGSQQIILINELRRKIKLYNEKSLTTIRLFIKTHPRDNAENYASLLKHEDVILLNELDTSKIDESYCFISVLSTLSSELKSAGYRSIYLCDEFFKEKYKEWYHNNCIEPFDLKNKNLIENIVNHKIQAYSLFNKNASPERIMMTHMLNS